MNHAYATKGKVLNLPNISVLFNKWVTINVKDCCYCLRNKRANGRSPKAKTFQSDRHTFNSPTEQSFKLSVKFKSVFCLVFFINSRKSQFAPICHGISVPVCLLILLKCVLAVTKYTLTQENIFYFSC